MVVSKCVSKCVSKYRVIVCQLIRLQRNREHSPSKRALFRWVSIKHHRVLLSAGHRMPANPAAKKLGAFPMQEGLFRASTENYCVPLSVCFTGISTPGFPYRVYMA